MAVQEFLINCCETYVLSLVFKGLAELLVDAIPVTVKYMSTINVVYGKPYLTSKFLNRAFQFTTLRNDRCVAGCNHFCHYWRIFYYWSLISVGLECIYALIFLKFQVSLLH